MNAPNIIYSLPQIEYKAFSHIQEERPVALLTSQEAWSQFGSALKLPIVVQAEPANMEPALLTYLSDNLPAPVKAVYVLGAGDLVDIGKLVAHNNNLPLIVLPTQLDTDQMLEAHVEMLSDGIINNIFTGAAERIYVDWDVIQAAPVHLRAGMMADMVSVVTGLLDWRYAVKQKRTAPNENFIPWAAGVAASLATQTIKMAEDIGRGEIAALRTLLDLTSISVQMANQLGHARQQEGTEHYFAFALAKHGVNVSHAEALGPGILFTSALHSQDPSSLREALLKAGIRLDQLRQADVQLVINDLPSFVRANDLPYGIAHELDPFSDHVQRALQLAGLSGDTGGWKLATADGTPPLGLPPAQ